MHDRIFENQRELEPAKFVEYAKQIGLNVDRFIKDVDSPEIKRRLDDDVKQASSLDVNSTPAFFINGKYLAGAKPFAEFKQMIDQELAGG